MTKIHHPAAHQPAHTQAAHHDSKAHTPTKAQVSKRLDLINTLSQTAKKVEAQQAPLQPTLLSRINNFAKELLSRGVDPEKAKKALTNAIKHEQWVDGSGIGTSETNTLFSKQVDASLQFAGIKGAKAKSIMSAEHFRNSLEGKTPAQRADAYRERHLENELKHLNVNPKNAAKVLADVKAAQAKAAASGTPQTPQQFADSVKTALHAHGVKHDKQTLINMDETARASLAGKTPQEQQNAHRQLALARELKAAGVPSDKAQQILNTVTQHNAQNLKGGTQLSGADWAKYVSQVVHGAGVKGNAAKLINAREQFRNDFATPTAANPSTSGAQPATVGADGQASTDSTGGAQQAPIQSDYQTMLAQQQAAQNSISPDAMAAMEAGVYDQYQLNQTRRGDLAQQLRAQGVSGDKANQIMIWVVEHQNQALRNGTTESDADWANIVSQLLGKA